ncbi:uncharacterized protein LOC110994122 [Pieris rapae]|uniref:uncharacterized protein LOC110994122 n=1 Tax=Pieris rapae TaxID=64459 RepID=UPI001E2811CB|nr:uncharacterized protein LOC110994122 [Pieris rapae]
MPTTDDRVQQTADSMPNVSAPSLTPMLSTAQSVPSTIPIATIQPMPKSSEPLKPPDDITSFPEKPTFVPPKSISQSPKISPSSIPNPSPSATTTKPVQLGYPNYGCYMYSVPVYSAFQPVSYPVLVQPNNNQRPITDQVTATEIVYPQTRDGTVSSEGKMEEKFPETLPNETTSQTDFEENFTPKVIPTNIDTNIPEGIKSKIDSVNDNLNSPGPISTPMFKDSNKKPISERFSLKTSIPISKIDMKCVTNTSDSLQSSQLKKPFNPAFHTSKTDAPKIEIQSNVLIKENKLKDVPGSTNSINTLITAAEVISQAETQFRKPDTKTDVEQNKDACKTNMLPPNIIPSRTIFNPINLDSITPKFSTSQERANDQKSNQLLLIQNKNSSNQKMLLAIQQQPPQVPLSRSGVDQKNLQTPSRQISQAKKSKEELVNENETSSKVVSLKRMHQDDCDENDFENLITENQIYGNKIVVKEKSQGTLQEQEIKNKNKVEKAGQPTSKNLVLQSNFVYLSNVQFPANVMMIKNNVKVNNEALKPSVNEIKPNADISTTNKNIESVANSSITKATQENKEVQILGTNDLNLKLPSTNSNTFIQTPNSKVIRNSQLVYQVPMIMDRDNQHIIGRDGNKFVESKNEAQKIENNRPNDKIFIACQMDSKLQPKLLITNIRAKLNATEEVSSLDLYEKRKRLRRLKHLTNRNSQEPKKNVIPAEEVENHIITPEKMIDEIYNEFYTKKSNRADIESGSEYEDDDIIDYEKVIKDFSSTTKDNCNEKKIFLANFRLTTFKDYKEREMDRQERSMKKDAIASAYITAGRIDCLTTETNCCKRERDESNDHTVSKFLDESGVIQQRKQTFLSRLKLTPVTKNAREGYEKIWQEVLKERKRREKPLDNSQTKQRRLEGDNLNLGTSDQLKLINEIKNQVNENHNLIKKRLDFHTEAGDSIKILAEKNFSELNRLSKMADISVKIFSGQDTRKRDLTPGFDSENIQVTKPIANYTPIKVPNIYKTRVSETITSTEETKPQKMLDDGEKFRDASCQVSNNSWPGVETFIKSYKEYDAARKKEILDLNRSNTKLRVGSAYVTRNASRDSDRAKALVAERKHLAKEETAVRKSIKKLYSALETIRSHIKS